MQKQAESWRETRDASYYFSLFFLGSGIGVLLAKGPVSPFSFIFFFFLADVSYFSESKMIEKEHEANEILKKSRVKLEKKKKEGSLKNKNKKTNRVSKDLFLSSLSFFG